jgi:hypothetical protein
MEAYLSGGSLPIFERIKTAQALRRREEHKSSNYNNASLD